MLNYVTFNLFDSPAQTLVNTVNTVGVMGKGIALIYKQLYPEMYAQYRRLCQAGEFEMGMLHIYRTPNKIIVNFPTKEHWRQKSRLQYIEVGLQKFVARYTDYGVSSVSFPQLGCGNGELDWETQVRPLMEKHLYRLPIPVYIHLYDSSLTITPERLDPEYAREIRLTRQRPSANQVWYDLENLGTQNRQLSLFGPRVSFNDEMIFFQGLDGTEKTIYREDIDEIWNVLRLRGTVSVEDMPTLVVEAQVTEWLFELLSRLEYIKRTTLLTNHNGGQIDGLRYAPLPMQTQIEAILPEIVV